MSSSVRMLHTIDTVEAMYIEGQVSWPIYRDYLHRWQTSEKRATVRCGCPKCSNKHTIPA